MIALLVAARLAITLLRSLARARTEALDPERGRGLTRDDVDAIVSLRARVGSALSELGRLVADNSLELPLDVRTVAEVVAFGIEGPARDDDAASILRMWTREQAPWASLGRCSCWKPGGPPWYECPKCAGIGYALPEATPEQPLSRPASRRVVEVCGGKLGARVDVCPERVASWFALPEASRVERTAQASRAGIHRLLFVHCDGCGAQKRDACVERAEVAS